jgi:hypothetical protein
MLDDVFVNPVDFKTTDQVRLKTYSIHVKKLIPLVYRFTVYCWDCTFEDDVWELWLAIISFSSRGIESTNFRRRLSEKREKLTITFCPLFVFLTRDSDKSSKSCDCPDMAFLTSLHQEIRSSHRDG